MNLANGARHNKRNNCYESLHEEEQLSSPSIRESVWIRSVCNKIMCSKCLQIPLSEALLTYLKNERSKLADC